MAEDSAPPPYSKPETRAARFPVTRWSLVAGLAGGGEAEREEALAELCQAYWFPLYAFVRHEGHGPEDAEDLTQGFFTHLLAKDTSRYLEGARGRLRSYLLGALKRFLIDEWRAATTQKRGGGTKILSLDAEEAQERYLEHHQPDDSAEVTFHRQWVLAVLNKARDLLRAKYGQGEKRDLFEAIEQGITDPDAINYCAVASDLGMNTGAMRTAVHRMRRRYGEAIREVIAETVSDPTEAEEEYRELVRHYA